MTKKILFFLSILFVPLFAEESNFVLVTENSKETQEWMHTLINFAEQSIDFVSYSTGGKAFCDLVAAIEKRMDHSPHLQACVLVSPLLIFDKECEILENLKAKYPERFHYQMSGNRFTMYPDYVTNENHIKCLVVDEKYYIVGGTNLHEAFCSTGTKPIDMHFGDDNFSAALPKGTRDMDIVGRGPLAHDLRLMYHQMYALWEHFETTGSFAADPAEFAANKTFTKVSGNKTRVPPFDLKRNLIETPKIKMVLSGPWQDKNAITQEYIDIVQKAQKEVVIANFYFNPAVRLFEKMREKVRAGVHFNVLTNGKWEGSPFYCSFIAWGNRVNYVPLIFGHEYHFWQWWDVTQTTPYNTQFFEYQVKDVLLHKKVMVVDKRYTLIGSYNLNVKSDYGDFELIFSIDSEKVAKEVLKVIEKDRTFAKEINVKQAIDWYFDPVSAYHGAFQKLFQGFL